MGFKILNLSCELEQTCIHIDKKRVMPVQSTHQGFRELSRMPFFCFQRFPTTRAIISAWIVSLFFVRNARPLLCIKTIKNG